MNTSPSSIPSPKLRPRLEAHPERSGFQSDLAISVRNVSKMYPLYADPRDRLKQSLWYALPKFLRSRPREFYREFWALRDISFDIYRGETLGIIGRNGSGKSTLLQIIAGTLTPSHGEVQINGRVAALLELGSGFNPEFTGRENVYLNGSILGLSQDEIDAIFDDILSFADIGQFIDQPVKLYSSGMFMRLAFAVQAFVPKEVFIVDEALSVGDEAFQRKCMRELEKFRENGGTVLLVSHDMQTVIRQCKRCLLLHQGELLADSDSKPVTDLYQKLMYSDRQRSAEILAVLRTQGLKQALKHTTNLKQAVVNTTDDKITFDEQRSEVTKPDTQDWFDPNLPQPAETSYSNGSAEIFDFGIYNEQEQPVNILVVGRWYRWSYSVIFHQDAYDVHFGLMLKTMDGIDIAGLSSKREHHNFNYLPAATVIEVSFSIKLNLTPGTYFFNVGVDGNDAQGARTYLHRRVDMYMIRVLPPASQEIYGLAYLEPRFSYAIQTNISPALIEVKIP